ncbi:MAG: hypothetical protein AAF743_06320 [Planctomycetota bacterium]
MRVLSFAVLLLFATLGCDGSSETPTHVFTGIVVDAAGQPVAGATVVAETHPRVRFTLGTGPPGMIDSQNGIQHQPVTDAQGKFTITLPRRHSTLSIRDIRAGNMQMVRDGAWQVTGGGKELDHTFYDFGQDDFLPEVRYVPDPNHPAIFPVHAQGDPRPVGAPSRGGTNMTKNGHVHVNQPVPVLIPSVGPNAVTTEAEFTAALEAIPPEERLSHIPSRQ